MKLYRMQYLRDGQQRGITFASVDGHEAARFAAALRLKDYEVAPLRALWLRGRLV